MQVGVKLTDREIECLEWLSINSWTYFFIDPLKLYKYPDYFGFRTKYRAELENFHMWSAFKMNSVEGKFTVEPLWLEVFRNVIKQHKLWNTTE